MSLLKYLQRDLESTPGLTCPSCRAFRIRGQSAPRTAGIAAVLTVSRLAAFLLLGREQSTELRLALLHERGEALLEVGRRGVAYLRQSLGLDVALQLRVESTV